MIVQDTNMSMIRGDTLAFAVEIAGLEQNLEVAKFSCKKNYSSRDYAFQKTLNDGITKICDDKYRVRVAPEDTADLAIGDYVYDLEIRVNGDVYTIMKGRLRLIEDVTRGE